MALHHTPQTLFKHGLPPNSTKSLLTRKHGRRVIRSQPMGLLSMGISERDRVQPITKDNRRIESKYRARLQKTKLGNFKTSFFKFKKTA